MEEWRDIPGYERLYEASTFGRIRTCEGKTTSSARFKKRVWKQRILKQKMYKNRRGRTDARVSLWKDGNEKTWLVSRLVAMTWVDGYKPEFTVNHIDGNSQNNNADNLEWITLAENIHKGFADGLYRKNQKAVRLVGPQTIEFNSMIEASSFLGRNSGYVSLCHEKGVKAKSIHGEMYRIYTIEWRQMQ